MVDDGTKRFEYVYKHFFMMYDWNEMLQYCGYQIAAGASENR